MIISSSKTSSVDYHILKNGMTVLKVTHILYLQSICASLLSVPPNLTD